VDADVELELADSGIFQQAPAHFRQWWWCWCWRRSRGRRQVGPLYPAGLLFVIPHHCGARGEVPVPDSVALATKNKTTRYTYPGVDNVRRNMT
jgi:hypothetical protein